MALCDQLADFLSRIHGLPLERVRDVVLQDDTALDALLTEATQYVPLVDGYLLPDCRRALATFVNTPPPPEPAVLAFCHNDLGAEHLLAVSDGTVLSGVIDWSDAAVTDPARDLGLILRDLGPAVAKAVLSMTGATDPHATLVRAAFYARCRLLEDLAYGLRTPDRRHVEHALRHFGRTFGDG
jgi:aminoglycoside phosphotransferase (APT) family kinase protein